MQPEQNNNYAQSSAKIAKLKKANKKLKHTNKNRKLEYNSDSKDSISSWSDGSGSPGKLGINCTKHNKSNTRINTYPSLNEATDNLDSNVYPILINEIFQSYGVTKV